MPIQGLQRTQSLRRNSIVLIGVIVALLGSPLPASAEGATASYLYNLSDFSGTLPYSWVNLYNDRGKNETYLITATAVKIFNENGMEVYTFGEDGSLGTITDVAVQEDGRILVLSRDPSGTYRLIRADYRGKPLSAVLITNVPSEYSDLSPGRVFYRNESIYLADLMSKKVIVTNSTGEFVKGFNIASHLAEEDKEGDDDIRGFSVDGKGNMFFTIPTIFRAFKLSLDGAVSAFGSAGSLPGKFNIVAGIDTDDNGYIYVADTLRCVIMIFDQDFRFLTEFGTRGLGAGDLIAPRTVATDGHGKVYVSQSRRRGVSVFKIAYN